MKEKGRGRAEMIGRQRQEIDATAQSLHRQLDIVRDSSLNETQLNDALERENTLRAKAQEFIDAGFDADRAKTLALEAAAREQNTRALARQIEAEKQSRQITLESGLAAKETLAQLKMLSSVPALGASGSVFEYASARASKMRDSLAQLDQGQIGYADVGKRWMAFDQDAKAKRSLDAGRSVMEAQLKLQEQKVKFSQRDDELSRQESQWHAQDIVARQLHVKLTSKELEARIKIRQILKDSQKITAAEYLRGNAQNADIAGIYDPRMRRKVGAILDAKNAGLTPNQIGANLPEILDTAKLKERREELGQVLSGVRDDISQMFLSIKDKGLGSITDLFTAISNRIQSFAADILATKLWDMIGGALGGFLGNRTGAQASPVQVNNAAHGSHAAGLGRVPFDGYRAILHKNEMVLTAAQATVERDRNRREALVATTRTGAGSNPNSMRSGSGDFHNHGDIHLHGIKRETDIPRAVRDQVQKAAPSRRTVSKGVRNFQEVSK